MAPQDLEGLKHIADILMAAAFADGAYQKVEGSTVRKILTELAAGTLPEAVLLRLGAFDADSFDLPAACAALTLGTPDERRQLLRLVARVTDCDDVHDLDESAYILKVARQIGATPEDYAGLTLDVVDEDDAGPPPLPSRAK